MIQEQEAREPDRSFGWSVVKSGFPRLNFLRGRQLGEYPSIGLRSVPRKPCFMRLDDSCLRGTIHVGCKTVQSLMAIILSGSTEPAILCSVLQSAVAITLLDPQSDQAHDPDQQSAPANLETSLP